MFAAAEAGHRLDEADGARRGSDVAERGELYGIMGFFEKPAELYHACEEVRDAGYKAFDAQTPFPVHGLEKAMGLKPTRLPFFVLAGGMTGLATAPHLHYEFRINGVHRDPLKVTLPPPEPLPGTLMAKFRAVTAPFIKQLAQAELRGATIAQR